MTSIIRYGENEDLEYYLGRVGRFILITTDRSSIAKSLERQLIDILGKTENVPTQTAVIGFHLPEEEGSQGLGSSK